jgi:hypothetical protein
VTLTYYGGSLSHSETGFYPQILLPWARAPDRRQSFDNLLQPFDNKFTIA